MFMAVVSVLMLTIYTAVRTHLLINAGVCVCVCFCAVFIVEMLHNFIKTTQKRFLHFYWLFAIISPYFDLICMCVCAFFVDFNCRLGEIPSIWIRNAKKNNTWERVGKKTR